MEHTEEQDVHTAEEMLGQYSTPLQHQDIMDIVKKFRSKAVNDEIKTPQQLNELFLQVKLFERLQHNMLASVQSDLEKNKAIDRKTKEMKKKAYKVHDEMFSTVISSPQWQNHQVRILFELLDTDHSGSISLKEFLSGFVLMLGGPDKSKIYELMFDIFDSDHSGTLTVEELKAGFPVAMRNNFFMLLTSFTTGFAGGVLVKLRSSLTVKDEAKDALFQVLFQTHQTQWTSFEPLLNTKLRDFAEKLFAVADVNKDKTLSKTEFVDFMKNDTSLKDEQAKLFVPELEIYIAKLNKTLENWVQEQAVKGTIKKQACLIC